MALNREFIGRTMTSAEVYEVSREKLHEFAVAIGQPELVPLDPVGGEPLPGPFPAPPTFATTLWFRMGTWPLYDPAFGKRKEPFFVLGGQRTVHHRPMVAGDRLVLTSTIHDIRDVGRHELLEIEHRLVTVDGEPVCTIVDSMISRGTAASPAASNGAPSNPAAPDPAAPNTVVAGRA